MLESPIGPEGEGVLECEWPLESGESELAGKPVGVGRFEIGAGMLLRMSRYSLWACLYPALGDLEPGGSSFRFEAPPAWTQLQKQSRSNPIDLTLLTSASYKRNEKNKPNEVIFPVISLLRLFLATFPRKIDGLAALCIPNSGPSGWVRKQSQSNPIDIKPFSLMDI